MTTVIFDNTMSFPNNNFWRETKGERQNTRTEKMDCPFTLKFKATLDGQALFLFNMNSVQNHDVSEAEFKFAPKERIVGKEVEKEIAEMVSLNANRKKIQQLYAEKTGKAILMKDIHNIATRPNNRREKTMAL